MRRASTPLQTSRPCPTPTNCSQIVRGAFARGVKNANATPTRLPAPHAGHFLRPCCRVERGGDSRRLEPVEERVGVIANASQRIRTIERLGSPHGRVSSLLIVDSESRQRLASPDEVRFAASRRARTFAPNARLSSSRSAAAARCASDITQPTRPGDLNRRRHLTGSRHS